MVSYASFSEWASSAVQIKETLDSIREVQDLMPEQQLDSEQTMQALIAMLEKSLEDYERAQQRFQAAIGGIRSDEETPRDAIDDPNR